MTCPANIFGSWLGPICEEVQDMRLKKCVLVLALSSLAACGDRRNEQSPTATTSSVKKVEQMSSKRLDIAKEGSREAVEAIDPPPATVGKNVYWGKCMGCHSAGVAGAPKVGDALLWRARIAQGMNRLYENAINGFRGSTGYMPPKGGYPRLSEDDVKAAVAYMVSMSQ